MNQFGICEWSLPVGGPFGVRLAAECGFDGIQLGDLGGGPQGFPMNHPRVQAGYLEEAERTGLRLHSLHLHTLVREGTMLYPAASGKGGLARESIQKGVAACAEMGIGCLMLSSFFATRIGNDYQLDNFAAMLEYACALGAERGVRIVYEGILHIDRLLGLLDRLGERLGVLYDTLNPIRFGTGEPAEEIRQSPAGCSVTESWLYGGAGGQPAQRAASGDKADGVFIQPLHGPELNSLLGAEVNQPLGEQPGQPDDSHTPEIIHQTPHRLPLQSEKAPFEREPYCLPSRQRDL